MKIAKTLGILAGATVFASALAACGGGGGGGSTGGSMPPISGGTPGGGSTSTPVPTPSPVGTPTPSVISGKVVSIPNTAYGPNAPQAVLANAIVIVGPTLILGSTPPPTLPAGDVQSTTGSDGAYSVALVSVPVAPNAATNAIFVVPGQNLSGVTPPTSGYYISVFAVGVNGKSANAPLPVHAFSTITAGAFATQRVTTATADEAANLAYLNAARVKANPSALPLTFDEIAQEVAREHVQDEAASRYACHFDLKNVGPESRYLRMNGLGANGENFGFYGVGTSQDAYVQVVDFFMKEGPGGGHYDNITGATRLWAGVSTAAESNGTQHTDDELVVPHQAVQFIYQNEYCPSGIVTNNS